MTRTRIDHKHVCKTGGKVIPVFVAIPYSQSEEL